MGVSLFRAQDELFLYIRSMGFLPTYNAVEHCVDM